MKTFAIATTMILGTMSLAHAQPAPIRGSDTLFDAVTEAINQAGLQDLLTYTGGGSGLGETGLRNGTQGIAPMSRALSDAGFLDLLNQGVTPVQHVIGLDGVSVFVKDEGATVAATLTALDIPTIRKIYTCEITDWSQISADLSGTINAYRRNDASGTTDVFRTLVGISAFGPCVTVVSSTADITDLTSTDPLAIGYAGLSGHRPGGNKAVAVAATASDAAIAPSEATIRDFSYPLARRLYVNYVSDGRSPSADEQQLLDALTSRGFMDLILQAHEFVTCLSDEDGGCP